MLPFWWNSSGASSPSANVPVETQFLLLELSQQQNQHQQQQHQRHQQTTKEYALLLPLIDLETGFRCSLRPSATPFSSMIIRIESGDEAVRTSTVSNALYCISGTDPYDLVERGVVAAAKISGTAQSRAEKQPPALLDYFEWCSWDSMYTDVNPAGLQAGLRTLAQGNCPPAWVIIDDGWQQTELDQEFKRHGKKKVSTRGVLSSFRDLSLAQVRSRRASAEALCQDLQLTAPLRAVEAEKTLAADEKKRSSASFVAFADGVHGAARGDWSRLASLPRRWVVAAWSRVDALRSKLEALVMKHLQTSLETSHSDSSAIEVFTAMATGPFRKPLLRFYASASSHSRRLLSVKANGKFSHIDAGPDAAPLESQSSDFGGVIATLKQRCGVKYVLCWHAMMGYWSGVMPGAPEVAEFDPELLFPRPSPGTLEVDASMKWNHPAVVGCGVPRRPRLLHNAMHSYLADNGVDGVKVDVQATVSMFGWNNGGYVAAARRFHDSLQDSVAAHFPGNLMLSSMCCDLESIYNMKYSALARVGEDFYPTIKASHTAHIANAAFTSLMIGPLAFVDWDMMHSNHEASAMHAAARAVSGGLVYVSDKVGDHCFEVLQRLVLPQGTILRAQHHGRPTLDCLFKNVSKDKETVLKIWNMNAVTGVIGAFNVQGAAWEIKRRNYFAHDANPPALKVRVKAADVPRFCSRTAGKYVLYSDKQKRLQVMATADEEWEVELAGGGGHDVFVVSPVSVIETDVEVAPVGLVNMLNAGGALMRAKPAAHGTSFAMDVLGG